MLVQAFRFTLPSSSISVELVNMAVLCDTMDRWPFALSGILAHLLCMSWHYQRLERCLAKQPADREWLMSQCPALHSCQWDSVHCFAAAAAASSDAASRWSVKRCPIQQCGLNRTVLYRAATFLFRSTEPFSFFLCWCSFSLALSPIHCCCTVLVHRQWRRTITR